MQDPVKRNGNNMAIQWRKNVMDAVYVGDAALFDKLLESANKQHGSDKYLDFVVDEFTPLMLAICVKGDSDWVEKLLCAGANVDFCTCDDDFTTPLMHAACQASDDKSIVRVLLSNGANVNAMDRTNYQALHYTIILSDNIHIASLLLESGAELHHLRHSNSHFKSALFWKRPHLLNLFLHHADKRGMHISLEILYNWAIECWSEDCAILILKQGYYPHPESASDGTSYTSCFHKASCHGLIKLMGFLLELNPHFMQEDWLVQRDLHAYLRRHSDFVSWVTEQRKYPSSLVKLCRSRILAQLNTYYTHKVTELPLPNALQIFLTNMESVYIQV